MNRHQFFYLRCHLHRCRFHLSFSRRLSCKKEFSSQLICRFNQCYFMSSFMENLCSFHSGHSASDHPYFFRCFCFIQIILCLVTDRWISHAGNMRTVGHITESVIAALITAHTVYDLIHFSRSGFVCKFRIRKLGSSQYYHIHFILRQNLFCQFCCVDPSNTNCQHACLFADSGRIFNVKSVWHINWRHLIHGCCRNDISSGHIQYIDSMLFCNLTESDHFLDRQSVLQHIILRIDPDEQRHSFRHIPAQFIDHFQRKSAAVLKAAAIFVLSVIESCT